MTSYTAVELGKAQRLARALQSEREAQVSRAFWRANLQTLEAHIANAIRGHRLKGGETDGDSVERAARAKDHRP